MGRQIAQAGSGPAPIGPCPRRQHMRPDVGCHGQVRAIRPRPLPRSGRQPPSARSPSAATGVSSKLRPPPAPNAPAARRQGSRHNIWFTGRPVVNTPLGHVMQKVHRGLYAMIGLWSIFPDPCASALAGLRPTRPMVTAHPGSDTPRHGPRASLRPVPPLVITPRPGLQPVKAGNGIKQRFGETPRPIRHQ